MSETLLLDAFGFWHVVFFGMFNCFGIEGSLGEFGVLFFVCFCPEFSRDYPKEEIQRFSLVLSKFVLAGVRWFSVLAELRLALLKGFHIRILCPRR